MLNSLITIALLFCFSISAMAQQPERVALLIGNSNYENGPLANPGNDVDALETSLTKLGFAVTKHKDLNRTAMQKVIAEIANGLTKDDLLMFFYAGNAVGVDGFQYFVPIGAKLESRADLATEAISMLDMFTTWNDTTCVKVLICDCNRDNPFPEQDPAKAVSGPSQTQIRSPEKMIVAFSTEPGGVALDGSGDHSPFVASLLEHLDQRPDEGLMLMTVLKTTALDVKKKTGQRPFLEMDASMQPVKLSNSPAN